jgi:hypothetical protein
MELSEEPVKRNKNGWTDWEQSVIDKYEINKKTEARHDNWQGFKASRKKARDRRFGNNTKKHPKGYDEPAGVHPKKAERRTPNSTKLTVHIGPHTHLDLGWLKTMDELYTGHDYQGDHKSHKVERVEYSYSTVILELERDPKKTFSFTEIKFM